MSRIDGSSGINLIKQIARVANKIERIEERLATPGLSTIEENRLQHRLERLRDRFEDFHHPTRGPE